MKSAEPVLGPGVLLTKSVTACLVCDLRTRIICHRDPDGTLYPFEWYEGAYERYVETTDQMAVTRSKRLRVGINLGNGRVVRADFDTETGRASNVKFYEDRTQGLVGLNPFSVQNQEYERGLRDGRDAALRELSDTAKTEWSDGYNAGVKLTEEDYDRFIEWRNRPPEWFRTAMYGLLTSGAAMALAYAGMELLS